jgi:ATP-dependent DNA helicase RecG
LDWLSQPLQFIKGVGPRRAAELSRVGLTTVEDLLLRFPRRYEDRAGLTPIGKLRPGHTATVVGEVLSSGVRTTRRPGFRLFEVVVRDGTGAIRAVFPNQAFLKDVFRAHQQVVLFGLLEYRSGGLQFTNAEYEIVKGDLADGGEHDDVTVHTGRIVPVYEKIGPITTRMQRSLIFQLMPCAVIGHDAPMRFGRRIFQTPARPLNNSTRVPPRHSND